MAKRKKKAEYISIVVPVGPSGTPRRDVAEVTSGEGVALQSKLLSFGTDTRDVPWEEFLSNWGKIRDQVSVMMEDFSEKTFGNMVLDELQVGLSATGKGSIGIASVTGAANIMLKFKKGAGE